MEKLVVIGGGGHAKVILDMIEENADYDVVGCIALDAPDLGQLPVAVLGDESVLPQLAAAGVRRAFVAVGDNRLRSQIARRVTGQGFELVNIVSRHSIVSRRAVLGSGNAIMPGAVINAYAKISDGCIINTGCVVDHDCVIAPWAHLAPQATLCGQVRIGEGAFLGVGAKVIPSISIGAWAVVGAGAVAVRNLPDYACAVGVPARITRKIPL